MGTANPKTTIDTHMKKKKQPKHNTTDVHQTTREENKRKRRKKTYKNKHKTIKKMAIGIHILIITLNVNGLNAPTKRHRLAEWIQKQDPYIRCLKQTHLIQGHIQAESEGMEEGIPHKWKSKESWSSNTHIRQNRL